MKRAAEFIRDLKWQDLDEKTIQTAKHCLLDYMGAVLGGSQTKTGEIAIEFARTLGGWGQATIWPTGEKVSCQAAAFAQATVGSALDIDDGHRMAVGHPGGVVIPAACAVAENNNSTAKELLEAIVCGYEVGIRAGHVLRLQQTQPISMGSGKWGALGAAAAVARLMHLNLEETIQCLAISATTAPVAPVTDDLKMNGVIPMTKFCSGWGNMVAIQGGLLAKRGFTGLISAVHFSLSKLPDFKKSFEINQTYFKPYPACRYAHPAIEGAMHLRKEHPDLLPENIRKVTVHVIQSGTHLNYPRPPTLESAQYSIPFLVGAALVDGEVGLNQVNEERLGDPRILKIAGKVEVRFSSELEAYFPKEAPAEVEIEDTSGRTYKKRVHRPKGDPQNPMSEMEFTEKFRRLARRCLPQKKTEEILTTVLNLEKLASLSEWTDLFRK